jgi:hypothetical protein
MIIIINKLIRLFQKVFLGLFISTLFPIDLIDVIKYFTPDIPIEDLGSSRLQEDSDQQSEDLEETNNNYLLVIIPVTTILITIIGGICDLHLDNLILNQTIIDLLIVAEEHVYQSEVTASNLYG